MMHISERVRNFLDKLQKLPDSKKKVILWTVVIIIGLVMGFFWFTGTMERLSTMPDISKSIKFPDTKFPDIKFPDISSIQSLDILKTITADWKTYTNNQYKFELKYPPNLSVKEGPSNVGYAPVIFDDNGTTPFLIYVGDAKADAISSIINPKSSDYTEIKNGKLTVNDVSWNVIEKTIIPVEGVGTAASSLDMYAAKGGSTYIFQCINCSKDVFGVDGTNKEAVFDQIILTFKFIN